MRNKVIGRKQNGTNGHIYIVIRPYLLCLENFAFTTKMFF